MHMSRVVDHCPQLELRIPAFILTLPVIFLPQLNLRATDSLPGRGREMTGILGYSETENE